MTFVPCRHYVNNLVQYATGVEGITRKATREVGDTSYYKQSRQSRPWLVLRLSTCIVMPSRAMRRSTLPPRARLPGRIAWCWWRTTSQMWASGHASRYSWLWHGMTCFDEIKVDC